MTAREAEGKLETERDAQSLEEQLRRSAATTTLFTTETIPAAVSVSCHALG